MWIQKEIVLKPRSRGFHLITAEILAHLPELQQFNIGMLNLLIKHTSASITINENAAPDVRKDFESYFNHIVPENAAYYLHLDEGADDMPAHIKSSILGSSLNIPISHGKLAFGTWQGIYLCEHRDQGGQRTILATLNGE
ncbi:MAG: secondary thiamine-phosphate synthase enzyme YjbQ [Methylophilus sp.]|jgi:secondary thiamine-phosphate synthase enzyme